MSKLPHKIWINHRFVGVMNTKEVCLDLPAGEYPVMIQSVFPFFYSTTLVKVQEGVCKVLSFRDREKWWDALFVIDLVLWFADRFFTLPEPWGLIYKIFTNGYLILWLIYEFSIRKRYFKIESYSEIPSE